MRTVLGSVLLAAGPLTLAGEWASLPALPDREGFAGPFAGVSNGALLVAGGANFPGKRPWDGGKKAWYDAVFVLEAPGGKWKVAGKLPRPLGYGVSVTHGAGVVCVGGSDAARHHADAFRLEWKGGRLLTAALPALPRPLANACGALVGDALYVAGGQERPDAPAASDAAYRLDLGATRPEWVAIEACPGGGRMLAVAAGGGGAFWVAGGVALRPGKAGVPERKYLQDAYRYAPGRGWTRVADLPVPLAAAPSPAPADGDGFLVLGGDDGSQVHTAPDDHRGFPKGVLRYDAKADRWSPRGEVPRAHVTTPCVRWGATRVVPGGEVRPGVRSPGVLALTPGG